MYSCFFFHFLIKPGGYIINVMKNDSRHLVPMYKDVFDAHCQRLVNEGKWERIYEHVNPNYFMKKHGLVQVFKRKGEIIRGTFEAVQQVRDVIMAKKKIPL